MIRNVAEALNRELYRQEWWEPKNLDNAKLPEDMVTPYIDQSEVDMAALARAAIRAVNDAIAGCDNLPQVAAIFTEALKEPE